MRLLALLLLCLCTGAACSQDRRDGWYRRLDGIDLGVFACAPNPGLHAISSQAELERSFAQQAAHCAPEAFAESRQRLLDSLQAAKFDWSRESLVVLEDWYGTGMARARLEYEAIEPDTLRVRIAWTVPPPPVTPDTALFRAALAVDRSQVRSLRISGRDPAERVLTLAPP